MLTASPTHKPVMKPDGFDLDRYIESGEFQYPVGPMIQLKARLFRGAAAHLLETLLSDDQVIESLDTDHLLVTLRCGIPHSLNGGCSALGRQCSF
jgi:hypothetical protein